MQVAKRIVFKITDPDADLDATMQAYSKGMNFTSRVVFRNKAPMSAEQLHQEVYGYLKGLGLRAQQCRSIIDRVAGKYQALKERKSGKKRWPYLKFTPSTMMMTYKKEFRIDKDTIKITSLTSGRKRYNIGIYSYARRYFDGTWQYIASQIRRHKDNSYYFQLELTKDVPNTKITHTSSCMGIDVGFNNYAVASTSDNKCRFFAAGIVKDMRNKYWSLRKRLELKGTSSAKRMIEHLAGKEKRLMQHINHKISKEIISFALENNVRVIALEDLYGIASIPFDHQMEFNSEDWFHRKLQIYIQYKAAEVGIHTIYVDPCNTSQTCSSCGYISRDNRDRLKFKCISCGYENNADLNAAMNIWAKVRDRRQDLLSLGRGQPPRRVCNV